MARDRGLRQIEVADDLADRALVPLEQAEDLLTGAVGQRFEDLGHVPSVAGASGAFEGGVHCGLRDRDDCRRRSVHEWRIEAVS